MLIKIIENYLEENNINFIEITQVYQGNCTDVIVEVRVEPFTDKTKVYRINEYGQAKDLNRNFKRFVEDCQN